MVLSGDDFWKAKIVAFLHDPPDKPAVLFHSGHGGHEGIASRLRKEIGLSDDDLMTFGKLAERADHLASGADRPPMSKADRSRIDFQTQPRIIHPLSGQTYDLGSFATHDWESVTAQVSSRLGSIAASYGEPHGRFGIWQRRFLSLWRELRSVLIAASETASIGSLWDVFPADTRCPDHSIWDHLRLTSALVGALSGKAEPALLLFSIGPVQAFIAAARKTQDLWAGSWILSWLSWCAMRPVVERLGPDAVMFPELWGQPLVDRWLGSAVGLGELDKNLDPGAELLAQSSLPNRFLAVVPGEMADEIARAAASGVATGLGELGGAGFRKALRGRDVPEEGVARVVEQLEDYFECRWAALDWPTGRDQAADLIRSACSVSGGEPTPALRLDQELRKTGVPFWRSVHSGGLYGDLYSLAERGLAAVKMVQPFASRVIPPGPRCAQTGDLAPVLQGPPRPSETVDGSIPESTDLSIGERLSAVVLVKRELRRVIAELPGVGFEPGEFAGKVRFPSTGSIAAARYLEDLADSGLPEAHALARVLEAHPEMQDRGLSVPARTHRSLLKAGLRSLGYLDARVLFAGEDLEAYVDEDGEVLAPEVQLAVKNLIGKRGRPTPYYALVLADGDSMGAWLSGVKAPKLARTYHQAVLDDMNQDAREVAEREPRPLSPALHASVSAALRTFSRDLLPELIEDHLSGKLIYSGGDDVLALLPLGDLTGFLATLPCIFSGDSIDEDEVPLPFSLANGFVKVNGRPKMLMGTTASISAGVVIAHQKEPFSAVLAAAKEAEKSAKSIEGKAAVTVSVLKHSGERLLFRAPWACRPGSRVPRTAALLRRWSEAFGDGCEFGGARVRVSPRVVRAFTEEVAPLFRVPGGEAAATGVLGMLTMRHADAIDGDGSGISRESREALMANLVEPTAAFGTAVAALRGDTADKAIAELLQVAVFLARHRGGNRGRTRKDV